MLGDYYNSMLHKVASEEIEAKEYLSIEASKVDEKYSKKELTALALTAHTILNLDETITRG